MKTNEQQLAEIDEEVDDDLPTFPITTIADFDALESEVRLNFTKKHKIVSISFHFLKFFNENICESFHNIILADRYCKRMNILCRYWFYITLTKIK